MNEVFAPPAPTAFDAITAAITAALYLAVALAAIARVPRDVRARMFLAVAVLNIGPAAGTLVLWREGAHATYTPGLVAMLSITTLVGSVALFHFTQLFPSRRPWLTRHAGWLAAGYAAVMLVPPGLVAATPRAVEDVTVVMGLVAAAVALPLIVVFGIVVPLAGLVSLYRSYLEAGADNRYDAARAAWWMLISQLGGGILAAILLPLLHMLAVSVTWTTAASAVLFAFGILMPLAYAAAVWKFRLLDPSTAT